MAKIIGNTTSTPNPRPDWNQTDETKADYIKNKPVISEAVAEAISSNITDKYNPTPGDIDSLKAVNSWAVKSAIESSIDGNFDAYSNNAQSGIAVMDAIYNNASKTYSPTDGFPQSGIAVAEAIQVNIDQTADPTSPRAQSGIAVSEAILASIYSSTDKEYSPTSENAQSGVAVAEAIEQAFGNIEGVDGVEIVQTTGDSETAVMSQKATTENFDMLFSRFKMSGGNNILNPANSESGYFVGTAGQELELKASGSNERTIESIPCVTGETLYIYTNVSETVLEASPIIYYAFLDDNDLFVSGYARSISQVLNPTVERHSTISSNIEGASKLRIYVNGVNRGVSLSNFCISRTKLDGFEEYSEKMTPTTLKPEALYGSIDYNYSPTSLQAQSGVAVAEAIEQAFGNIEGVDGVEIVQTTGDSETAVMSQKAVTDNLNELSANLDTHKNETTENFDMLFSRFEMVASNNLLNPDNCESGYFVGTKGQPLELKASTNHQRVVDGIPFGNGEALYICCRVPEEALINDPVIYYAYFDENGLFLSGVSRKITTVINPTAEYHYKITPVTGATQIKIWVQQVNDGVQLSDFCISRTKLEAFEEYNGGKLTPKTLKPEALPPETVYEKPFNGKTIVNFGDSIFGNYRPPNDISTEIAKLTGATVHNCGFGGCRMASHSIQNFDAFSMYRLADAIATQSFTIQDAAIESGKTAATEGQGKLPSYFEGSLELLKSIDFSKVDIITIAYGTNDFTGGKLLENDDDLYDTKKFAGALRYSIETLLGAYPHLRIFVCGQTYRFWMDDSGAFTEDSDVKVLSGGKLTDFVAKTKQIAEEYHLPFVDNYHIGMNKHTRTVYFPATDGTHPNPAGRGLIARHIAHELF